MDPNPTGLASLSEEEIRTAQREDHVKKKGVGSHLQARERGLRMKPTLYTP